MSLDNYSIPLNAYPLGSSEGRAIPFEVTRPGWVIAAAEATILELPDEVNLVTIHAASPLILMELGNLKPEPAPEIAALGETPLLRGAYIPAGKTAFILSRWIRVSGECVINGHVLWQQMRPTTKWRT